MKTSILLAACLFLAGAACGQHPWGLLAEDPAFRYSNPELK